MSRERNRKWSGFVGIVGLWTFMFCAAVPPSPPTIGLLIGSWMQMWALAFWMSDG